ncbi:cytochrome P450 [Mycobacteroides abscessus subsp. bolletii]|uniref:cytochrome P450 n=1 Tax=Mycobacteroides abscessus TaxID=36809 RepID=UPI0009A5BFBA|nr:cytochrome P450 [Mycobacteroides abscessus]SKG69421.1 cytochrome P450 [Mycobacteroides abscessus subsp. bolletii]SKH12757.1 cytochrome P450 [Mycobacteroides abscessus subsp. bolletii]
MTTTFIDPPVSDADIYSDDVLDDPYETYRQLRDAGPVVQLTSHPIWVLTRYADVRSALADAASFASGFGIGVSDEMAALQAGSVLASDDPEHAKLRSILTDKLAPRALTALHASIAHQADALVADVVSKGRFDAVSDLAARLPVDVVADLIGLPAEGREVLLSGADAMFASFGPLDTRLQSRMSEVMDYVEYMTAMTSQEKLTPGSWGAAILDAVDDGRLAPESAMPLLAAYLIAGMDTTVHALGNYIRILVETPAIWAQVKADPTLIARGFEENLRLESPVQSLTRLTTRDVNVDGTVIPAGTRVALLYGSANRDERHYADPELFDFNRKWFDHLAFGYATHSCAGQGLARLEAEALVAALVRRVDQIEIVAEPVRHVHPIVRGLERLHVAVTPAQEA